MKVLITSGGTKIPIDKVRSITNMSNGTLGTKLATCALKDGHDVIFLRAKKSKSPMQCTLSMCEGKHGYCRAVLDDMIKLFEDFRNSFHDFQYETFEEYQEKLECLIRLYKPDLIILAAAVSDYAPETVVDGKIRTGGDLNIALKPLPKVIASVRKWAGEKPFIVGFKLLVGSTYEELCIEAKHSLINNSLDLVCANELNHLLAGNHTLHVVSETRSTATVPANSLWSLIDERWTQDGWKKKQKGT